MLICPVHSFVALVMPRDYFLRFPLSLVFDVYCSYQYIVQHVEKYIPAHITTVN